MVPGVFRWLELASSQATIFSAIISGMLGSSSEVKVRKSKLVDAASLADVFSESWRNAYLGIIPATHLEDLIRRRSTDWWTTALRSGDDILTLTVAGKIAGYATYGRTRARGPYRGEIYELYLAPTYQGLGFGEHLFEACRHGLDLRGLIGLLVWALKDNEGACDFYLRRGGRVVAKSADLLGGSRVEKLAFAWD